jgi:hypothetical protein
VLSAIGTGAIAPLAIADNDDDAPADEAAATPSGVRALTPKPTTSPVASGTVTPTAPPLLRTATPQPASSVSMVTGSRRIASVDDFAAAEQADSDLLSPRTRSANTPRRVSGAVASVIVRPPCYAHAEAALALLVRVLTLTPTTPSVPAVPSASAREDDSDLFDDVPRRASSHTRDDDVLESLAAVERCVFGL